MAAAAAALLCATTLTPAHAQTPPTSSTTAAGAAAETYLAALTRQNEAVSAAIAARAEAKQAAAAVRAATQTELAADIEALAATRTLNTLARQQYIAGPAAQMGTVISAVTGGPETLAGIELAEVATHHVGQQSADTAAETLDAAERAAAATRDATTRHAAAAEKQAAALAEVAAAEGEVAAAEKTYNEARQAAACEPTQGGLKPPTPQMIETAEKIVPILQQEGLPPPAIAAVLGNLQQESGLDPTKHQTPTGPGRGLAQWSTGGRWDTGDRNAAKFADETGGDLWTTETQTRFMLYEMRNKWGGFDLDVFKSFTDVVDAAVYMHDRYEKSADSADFVRDVRGGYAKQWYQWLPSTGDGCGTLPATPPEGLNLLLPDGWSRWEVPGGSTRLHPDARRIAQYAHATEPGIATIGGWDASTASGRSDGLTVTFDAPDTDAARIAEFFARYATQFGVERVRYGGREYNTAQPPTGEGWGQWPQVKDGNPDEAKKVTVTVWGGRAPERGAPNGLWAGV